ncbi:MAG: TIR domain-containing protein [Nocardioides sp.]
MSHWQQRQLQQIAEAAARRKVDSTRHKCFISHHAADSDEVAVFLDNFGTEFIAKTVGVTDEDDFIDSDDTGYVMDQIRTKYLGDSSVTIVLVGKCTWARRYVDWEVYSSLRNSKHSKVNGLLAIELPSVAGTGKLQARVNDNVIRDSSRKDVGYARWVAYPISSTSLRLSIEDAFKARTARAALINNTRDRRVNNAACS